MQRLDESELYWRPTLNNKGIDKASPVWVPVKAIDIRETFNRLDVLITPIGGKGQTWVGLESVIAGQGEDWLAGLLDGR
jgi:hypothetical protein